MDVNGAAKLLNELLCQALNKLVPHCTKTQTEKPKMPSQSRSYMQLPPVSPDLNLRSGFTGGVCQ